jgi:hypothetical protein
VQVGLARRGIGRLAAAALAALVCAGPASADDPSPFEPLLGRWVGEGRFGTRSGSTEVVKCRVTYISARPQGDELRQSIRCASAGGSVEVQSTVVHAAGALSGTWKELVRDLSGDLKGSVTPRGFRVAIRGEGLQANMDIILKDRKQIIEIQFIESTLIGLTLVLEKG